LVLVFLEKCTRRCGRNIGSRSERGQALPASGDASPGKNKKSGVRQRVWPPVFRLLAAGSAISMPMKADVNQSI